MSLVGSIRAAINLTQTPVSEIGSATASVLNATNQFNWPVTDGVAINKADLVYTKQRTLGIGASEELDLYGVLTDTFGVVLNFAKIKMIYVKAKLDNGALIKVGNAAANQWVGPFGGGTETQELEGGAMYMAATPSLAGWAVTNGSADKLGIENSDGAAVAVYDIVLVGTSA